LSEWTIIANTEKDLAKTILVINCPAMCVSFISILKLIHWL